MDGKDRIPSYAYTYRIKLVRLGHQIINKQNLKLISVNLRV